MFRIVDRGGAVVAAAAAVVCLATLSWIATGGSSGRFDRPGVGYPGTSGDAPSLSATSTTSADGGPAPAASQPAAGELSGGTLVPLAAPTDGTGSPAPSLTASPSADASGTPLIAPGTSPSPGASAPVSGDPSAPWAPSWPSGAPAGAPSANASPAPSTSAPAPSGSASPPAFAPAGSASPSASPSATSSATSSAAPDTARAADGLVAGAPRTEPGRRAGCVRVVVPFTDTGAAPVRSGRIVITTDVVDGFGGVRARYGAVAPLPLPIAAGARVTAVYDLCAAAGRVPAGTHLEAIGVALEG